MGIDVYLKWKGMSENERKKQFTGFDITKGNVGYLREAYHGEPYATKVLISEDWDSQPDEGFKIPNKTLVERLPEVIKAAIERGKIYGEILTKSSPAVKSYIDFIELHGKLEAAGKKPTIIISY